MIHVKLGKVPLYVSWIGCGKSVDAAANLRMNVKEYGFANFVGGDLFSSPTEMNAQSRRGRKT
jgi:hypothetical protein